MYFDLEEGHPDIYGIGRAMSWREGVLLSLVVHLVLILAVVLMPPLPSAQPDAAKLEEAAALQRQRERESQRFVFVQPRLEMPATRRPQPRADLSDRDRNAQALRQAPNPTNAMPFSRGNTPERVDAPGTPPQPRPQPEAAQPQEAASDQRSGSPSPGPPGPSDASALAATQNPTLPAPRPPGGGGSGLGAGLANALRNVQRYVPGQIFDNPQGGANAWGPAIQFDTKGVEFGPWVRRFIAQIKRNWFIPYAAMSMRGHVVITFNVHKDGSITDLGVAGPCPVDAFNNSSFNALAASSPTYPLPPEYPADKAFFTVTFYYNEAPPGG